MFLRIPIFSHALFAQTSDEKVYSALGVAICILGAFFLLIIDSLTINKCLKFFGAISLEVYMINHFLQNVLGEIIGRSPVGYLAILILGCLISLVVKVGNKKIISLTEGKE